MRFFFCIRKINHISKKKYIKPLNESDKDTKRDISIGGKMGDISLQVFHNKQTISKEINVKRYHIYIKIFYYLLL